jgi:hypothetical protein
VDDNRANARRRSAGVPRGDAAACCGWWWGGSPRVRFPVVRMSESSTNICIELTLCRVEAR